MAVAASPGRMSVAKKTMIDTTRTDTTPSATRRASKAAIGWARPVALITTGSVGDPAGSAIDVAVMATSLIRQPRSCSSADRPGQSLADKLRHRGFAQIGHAVADRLVKNPPGAPRPDVGHRHPDAVEPR